jgi:3-polyprenyl-4-hydroxybenzoate decarboxylase
VNTTRACGRSPVSLCWARETKPYFSFSAVTLSSPHQGDDVFVKNFALAIGQIFEERKGGVEFGLAVRHDAQLFQALLEGIAPRDLPSTILLALQPTSSARMIS